MSAMASSMAGPMSDQPAFLSNMGARSDVPGSEVRLRGLQSRLLGQLPRRDNRTSSKSELSAHMLARNPVGQTSSRPWTTSHDQQHYRELRHTSDRLPRSPSVKSCVSWRPSMMRFPSHFARLDPPCLPTQSRAVSGPSQWTMPVAPLLVIIGAQRVLSVRQFRRTDSMLREESGRGKATRVDSQYLSREATSGAP